MRIHRTTPTRAFSVLANALLRDRSISWCAVGVLTYLLSLPNGARATIRTLAEQRKEGRARIAAALRELEESRYLRRVVRKDRESGQLFTVYEVFDTPYDEEPPAGEPEKSRTWPPASWNPPPVYSPRALVEDAGPRAAERAGGACVGARRLLAVRSCGRVTQPRRMR